MTLKANQLILTALPLISFTQNAFAEESELSAPAWSVEIPAVPEKFDWLLVHKGELLGGDIIAMYDERVEFDSDEVGVHKVKMKDIKELRTKNIMRLRFLDGTIIEGHIIITEDNVYTMENPTSIYPRDQILSIVPSEKSGESLWSGEVSAGLNFKSGNTESFDYYFDAKVNYLISSGRIIGTYKGIFEKVRDKTTDTTVTTEDNHRLTAKYDYYYSHKLFFTLPSYDLVIDRFRNIRYQTALGVAVGYEAIDIKGMDLEVYAGPSVQVTHFDAVEPGEDEVVVSPVLAFGFDFEYDITSDIEYFLVYDAKVVNAESGQYIQRTETGIEIELIDDFDLEITAIIDNTLEPIADENGIKPEPTDILFTIGIEYEF